MAALLGVLVDLGLGDVGGDHVAQLGVEGQDPEDAHLARVAGVVAVGTAHRAVEHARLVDRLEEGERLIIGLVGHFAGGAEPADQANDDNASHGVRHGPWRELRKVQQLVQEALGGRDPDEGRGPRERSVDQAPGELGLGQGGHGQKVGRLIQDLGEGDLGPVRVHGRLGDPIQLEGHGAEAEHAPVVLEGLLEQGVEQGVLAGMLGAVDQHQPALEA
ncbi:hypothetical protein D3C87_1512740 [compost metagenome]